MRKGKTSKSVVMMSNKTLKILVPILLLVVCDSAIAAVSGAGIFDGISKRYEDISI